jgi:hypothetical protein
MWFLAFEERLTKEQAEQAMRSFEFPTWVCIGIMYVEHEQSWALKIASSDRQADFRLFVPSHWLQFYSDNVYIRQMHLAYRAWLDQGNENTVEHSVTFQERYLAENPHTFSM